MSTTSRHHHARVFWALQLGGWTAYALALMVPWLGRYPISVMWSNKLVIAATGLATSSLLRLVYRRVAREGAGLAMLCVTAVAASVAGAFAWNAVASAILGRSLQNDSVLLGALGRTFPRFDGVLYHALVLLTWSLLYLGSLLPGARARNASAAAGGVAGARGAPARAALSDRAALSVQRAERHLDAGSDRSQGGRDGHDRAPADLLRVSLETPERGTITLASELEIVRAYVAIERVRFGDRLQGRDRCRRRDARRASAGDDSATAGRERGTSCGGRSRWADVRSIVIPSQQARDDASG
jgi:hypothetical protein